MVELVKWDEAKRAIAEAKSIDEVKVIRDKAEAMRAYAKQIGESLGVQNDVCEIKLRCERRMGEMLKEQIPHEGGRPKQSQDVTVNPTLKDFGIERMQSHRYQKIADLPDDVFENLIIETKEASKELSEALLLTTARKIDREVEIQQLKKDIAEGKVLSATGLYDVIVVDPPWEYNTVYDPDHYMGRVANPYPEMSVEDIKNISLPNNKDCILWLWTTHSHILDAFDIMNYWGFEYKACMVWDKEIIGIGKWLRKQCEFCLLGVKGNPKWFATDWRDIILEKRTSHSVKPQGFYDLVDKYCIGRKLDYFARNKRKGWDVIGTLEND